MICYPNPVNDNLLVRSSLLIPFEELKMYDISGKLILSRNINEVVTEFNLDLSGLISGVYFLSVSRNGEVESKTIVVE